MIRSWLRDPLTWCLFACLGLVAACVLIGGCKRASKSTTTPTTTPTVQTPGRSSIEQTADESLSVARAELAASAEKVERLQALVREAERESRHIEAQAQAKWGRRIAWLVTIFGTVMVGASFIIGFPKRWGVIGAASGVGLRIAAEMWLIIDAWILPASIALLLGGALVGIYLAVRAGLVAKLFAKGTDEALEMVDEDMAFVLKARMQTKQKAARAHGLAQRIRGKRT